MQKNVGAGVRCRPVLCGLRSWNGFWSAGALSSARHHLHLSCSGQICGCSPVRGDAALIRGSRVLKVFGWCCGCSSVLSGDCPA